MPSLQLTLLILASLTWVAFGVGSRYYFRHSRRVTREKRWLTFSAYVCTIAQLIALAVVPPPSGLLAGAGLACFVLANVLYWWALLAHGRTRPAFAFIPVAPAAFTEVGPYRLVRHPIYTAYLLTWIGGPAATGQLWLLLLTGWMGWLYYRAARQEEHRFTDSPFAGRYAQYQQRTGMFWPRIL